MATTTTPPNDSAENLYGDPDYENNLKRFFNPTGKDEDLTTVFTSSIPTHPSTLNGRVVESASSKTSSTEPPPLGE